MSIDLSKCVGYTYEPTTFTYSSRDVILFALGIGAGADAPTDDQELRFTYENHRDFQVLPSFAVIPVSAILGQVLSTPGLEFNPMMLLHGEQTVRLHKQIPTSGTLRNFGRLSHVYDKGSGALVILDVDTKDEATGDLVFTNQFSLFVRGLGGFGGPRGPPAATASAPSAPARAPDVVHSESTAPNQALLYRLSGDLNPLHADPAMAALGKFPKPILHGLCSFGFAVRAVLKHFCENDASRVRSISVRFSRHVFPGERLVTEMWAGERTAIGQQVHFQTRVGQRGELALSGGLVEFSLPAGSARETSSSTVADQSQKQQQQQQPSASSSSSSAAAAGWTSLALFDELATRLSATPSLGQTIAAAAKADFQFEVTKGSETKFVILRMLAPSSGAVEFPTEAAENVTTSIRVADEDLAKLQSGELDGITAYLGGKLSVKGDLMASQRLAAVFEAATEAAEAMDAAAAAAAAVAPSTRTSASNATTKTAWKSMAVFQELERRFASSPEEAARAVARVGADFHFEVTNPDEPSAAQTRHVLVRLASGAGSVEFLDRAPAVDATCTIVVDDADLFQLQTGELDGVTAYMTGKVTVRGDLMASQKLASVFDTQSRL